MGSGSEPIPMSAGAALLPSLGWTEGRCLSLMDRKGNANPLVELRSSAGSTGKGISSQERTG